MIINDKDFVSMAFNPVYSPVYGGGTLEVHLDLEQINLAEGRYFVVFEGTRRRHVVSAFSNQPLNTCLYAYIPGNDVAEDVHVTLIQLIEESNTYLPLAQCYFRYEYDSTFYLTKFLVSSVYNVQALETLELIKSDRFDLSNEVLSTLDTRLSTALRNTNLTRDWHLLGGDLITDTHCEERETLLHFCARLGLRQVADFLLNQPGSQDALRICNKHGELPCTIARQNGFHDLAEMLSGYNTHGLVTTDHDTVEMDNAVLRSYGNGSTSLTSYLDSPSLERSVENEINFLKETEDMIRLQREIPGTQYYNSERPRPRPRHTGASRSMPTLPLEQEIEVSLDRLLQQQIIHCNTSQSFLRTSSLPASDGGCDEGRQSRETGSFDESSIDGGASDVDGGAPNSIRPSTLRPPTLSGEELSTKNLAYSVLEYSLSGVRDLVEDIFHFRDSQFQSRLGSKELKKQSLSRRSSSCPSLNEPVVLVRVTPLEDGDHHKSMHDLVSELKEPSQHISSDLLYNSGSFNKEGSFDKGIRICVNGVTVDSSEDFPVTTGSPSRNLLDPVSQKVSKYGHEQEDMPDYRRSWQHSDVTSGSSFDRKDRARILAMTGKSLSLTSLEGDDGSEDEDEEGHYNDLNHYNKVISIPSQRPAEDALSISPVDSNGSSPSSLGSGREMPDPGVVGPQKSTNDLLLSSHNTKSLSDLTIASESSVKSMGEPLHQSSLDSHPMLRQYQANMSLSVPHSTMTKSLSTPSIPNAMENSSDTSNRERQGKHHEELQYYFNEDFDAQFQRQKEIEEEEEEDGTHKKNDEHSPNESDEKSGKLTRKDDKKKAKSINVLSRLHNSYRTRKTKDKDTKVKERHHYVAISISNSTVCDVCHKPMANKAALKCENCLINVHEHNCKDHILHCDKTRNKALSREGSAHGPHSPTQMTQAGHSPTPTAHGGGQETKQFVPSGTSLRPTHSFKDKRTEPAPTKTQPGQLPAPSLQQQHRHSMPSMTDTISESMESLDGVVPTETSWLDEEPELQLNIEEREAWSVTVDRKVLKKLGAKDIKRQDTIWELINTEKQYVKRLKIMQKIFAQSMLHDLNFTPDQVDRLFPKLDELVELHSNFLKELLLRQTKNEDRSIDDIGDLLINQFGSSTAHKMKSVYGVFCSKHTEAMQLYKEFIKMDRKFQNFARKCTNLPVCEKRDISDFILGVTVRLSKYPILIEAVHKGTKDKKDRENLSQALLLCKEVVQHVDKKVAAYEKLMDIQSKLDNRAVIYKNKKFKRQDLNADNRELVHAGKIGWKSARGRVYDVLAVVLTDLIVFLQKNEQKYTFLMLDNKSCVIPLYRLLVREKRDAKDSLGIYMISQNKTTPEMYELVCQSTAQREEWIKILQEAIRQCPPDVEPELWPATNPAASVTSQEEEKKRSDEHANHIKIILEQLHQKDDAIKEFCDEKNKLILELREISAPKNNAGSRPNSQEMISGTESMEIVHAAMQEASHLTTILQGSGTQLSRSVSSVGEHHSNTFVATPVPKRAETFAGFDSSHDSPKLSEMKQRFINNGLEGEEDGSCSIQSLDQTDEPCLSDIPEASHTGKDVGMTELKLNSSPYAGPYLHGGNAHLWEEQAQSDRSSDRGSLGELSAASVTSLIPSPSNQEQMTSIFHLVQYLNKLMNLTATQCTKVESLSAELAEAKEEIAKLSADMQQGRRSVYKHDQLEELRNLQENISRERQEWERTKLFDKTVLEKEREKLEIERREIEKEKADLHLRKEAFKREKEALQRQIDLMKEQGILTGEQIDLDKMDKLISQQQRPISHTRSASADFYRTVTVNEVEQLASGDSKSLSGMSRQARNSVSSGINQPNTSVQTSKQPTLPVHLLSARNEQRVGGRNVQHLPLRLANNPGSNSPQSAISLSASYSGQQPLTSRAGSTSLNRVQSMSASTNPYSGDSITSKFMKMADHKGKSPSVSNVNQASHKPPAPQPGAASQKPHANLTNQTPATETEEDKDAIIYF
ncbi:A-kinase anchor protein 13-like isoform X5 [Biomphalaria glabrata]|uniref:A-kinase anchor protein 13-like isoform X5 n=1 Tax=Biomphalaria glabrata TaxID=6526 RepID=A0A9W2ZRA2_BIOGL|nr:A-kinase anchor protein 13-like isoform X5 [Biomphalaria glabrata]